MGMSSVGHRGHVSLRFLEANVKSLIFTIGALPVFNCAPPDYNLPFMIVCILVQSLKLQIERKDFNYSKCFVVIKQTKLTKRLNSELVLYSVCSVCHNCANS